MYLNKISIIRYKYCDATSANEKSIGDVGDDDIPILYRNTHNYGITL